MLPLFSAIVRTLVGSVGGNPFPFYIFVSVCLFIQLLKLYTYNINIFKSIIIVYTYLLNIFKNIIYIMINNYGLY